MLNNPEIPFQIPPKSVDRVNRRLVRAARRVGNAVREQGNFGYYNKARRQLPISTASQIRSLVIAFRDSAEEDALRLHPLSYAAELGLTTGASFAREALPVVSREVFFRRLSAQLHSLRTCMTESAYDLGDVARQAGRPFAGWLADAAPDVIDFDYGSEDPLIGEVYADTVGYIGFSAMTKLVEIEIRSVQPQDRKGVDQIGQHIDEIQARSAELSVEDFLSPS